MLDSASCIFCALVSVVCAELVRRLYQTRRALAASASENAKNASALQLSRATNSLLQSEVRELSYEVKIRQDIDAPAPAVGVLAFRFESIGKIATAFSERRSVPRQGCLTKAPGILQLHKHVSPVSLDGLEQYSHAWLVWCFHENTHKLTSSSSSSSSCDAKQRPKARQLQIKAKVRAPRLYGKKIGLFATRTPHRYNPIGLSLVRVDRVDQKAGLLHVTGVDLLDGTPILDVKPYIPYSDGADVLASVPRWVAEPQASLSDVEFPPDVLAKLTLLVQETDKTKGRTKKKKKGSSGSSSSTGKNNGPAGSSFSLFELAGGAEGLAALMREVISTDVLGRAAFSRKQETAEGAQLQTVLRVGVCGITVEYVVEHGGARVVDVMNE
jgi:tRNA (Thr-GGU) A37 N-methylase